MSEDARYYFWVGNKSGVIWAMRKDYELRPINGERFKYLGWTKDVGYPKKMNTGRVLIKPSKKGRKKATINRKKQSKEAALG